MGITEVKAYLDSKDALTNLILLQESAATVSEAARALKCNEDQIAKSIAFYSGDHKQAILIVSSGKSKIDNKAFKKEFGFKPKNAINTRFRKTSRSSGRGCLSFRHPAHNAYLL